MFIPMKSMMSTHPKIDLTYQALLLKGLLCVGNGRCDGFVDVVLLCCGDSCEEDLHLEAKLGGGGGGVEDLVELDDVADGVGVTLLNPTRTGLFESI